MASKKLFAEIQKELSSNNANSFVLNFKLEGEDCEKFDRVAGLLKKSRAELAKFIIMNSLDDILIHINSSYIPEEEKTNRSKSEFADRLIAITTPKIEALPVGTRFELKPLCGNEWDKIGDHGDKNKAGKSFKKLVEDGDIKNVKFCFRNEQRHAVYEKVHMPAEFG